MATYCCDVSAFEDPVTSLLAEGTDTTEHTSVLTHDWGDINFNNRGQQNTFLFDSQSLFSTYSLRLPLCKTHQWGGLFSLPMCENVSLTKNIMFISPEGLLSFRLLAEHCVALFQITAIVLPAWPCSHRIQASMWSSKAVIYLIDLRHE